MSDNAQVVEHPMAARAQGTPSIKLLATLGISGMIAGLLIVSAFELTLPSIEANRAARLEAAIFEVLPDAETFTPLYLYEDELVEKLPAGVDAKKLDKIFMGLAEDGSPAGYAIPTASPGFMDKVGVIFGYDAATGEVLGMKVLESKETPGLGSKVETQSSFIDGFSGVTAPLVGVKEGTSSAPGEVDVITGATISSRTVIRAINLGVDTWKDEIRTWEGRSRS